MRIEYQGVIEVRPSYQHVGYLAAAMMYDSRTSGGVVPPLFIGSGLMLLLIGAMVTRRMRSGWRWVVLTVAVLGVAALGVASARMAATVEVAPEFYVTMYRLEALDAQTEAWTAQHKRPPTAAEWRKLAASNALDGWGKLFEYRQTDGSWPCVLAFSPNGRDAPIGLGYVIWSERAGATGQGSHGGPGPHIGDLSNWHFGADGLFGTTDDERNFRGNLKLGRHKHLDPRKYPHARVAREVTPDAH